jgi:hypothetical protein
LGLRLGSVRFLWGICDLFDFAKLGGSRCLVCLLVLERCWSGRVSVSVRFGRIFAGNFRFLLCREIREQNVFGVFVCVRQVLKRQG